MNEYKPVRVKPAKTIYNALKRKYGHELTIDEYDEVVDSVLHYCLEDSVRNNPEVFAGNSITPRGWNTLPERASTMLYLVGEMIPEVAEVNRKERDMKSIRKGILEDAENFGEYRRYDRVEGCPSDVNGEQLLCWVSQVLSQEIPIEDLYDWNLTTINVTKKSSESISAFSRTSCWSTVIEGSMILNGNTYSARAILIHGVNRI